ncbi:MAG: ABC transporter transmembrane domain-containing protein [Bryobacteraceae bacterium]
MTAAAGTGLLSTLARILTHARSQWPKLIAVVALSLFDMGLNGQLSLSFQYLVDHTIAEKNVRALGSVAGLLCASIAIVTVSGAFRDRLYASATAEAMAQLRARLFEHLQRLSAGFYSRTSAGDILSHFTNDLGDIERTLLNGVPWGIVPLLDATFSTALVFWLDWRLALVAMLAFPVSLLGPKLLSKPATEASLARKEREAALSSSVSENVSAHSLVRAFALEKHFRALFEQRNEDVRKSASRMGFLGLSMERSAVLSTQVLQVAILTAGAWLVLAGKMSVGTFAAFQSTFVTLALSLSYLAQYTPQLAQAGGGLARVDQLLNEAPQVRDSERASELAPLSNAIEFRDVSFSYDGERKNLDGVNLSVPRGASVAFVGPSGSGKSTVLSLVMRFYDPLSGAVRVDGRDLRDVTSESLRKQSAVVFQENFLLDASIGENIRIARPEATAAELEDAVRRAGLQDLIATLPEGIDTVVGQSRLSGGQRQRIGIARALLRNPRILILDEATSALDSATEATINATIEEASRGRTVLSVTHRLGSAVKADRIFFLEKGRVAEQGTHQELLALGGGYARMWSKQSGFELSAGGRQARISPERLRAVPVLSDLEPAVLDELSRSFSTELYSKDRYVFNEGDSGDKFYILARGTVEVLKASAGGAQRRVEVLQDGDVFGEQALLMNSPRSASVRCMAECTMLVLERDKFQALIEKVPELRWKLRESASIGEYRNEEAAAGLVSPWSKFRHDLLTPVNHMAGYGEMLEEEFEDSANGPALRHATEICRNARSLQAHIDRWLPSGRQPAPEALPALRHDVETVLAAIDQAAAAIRKAGPIGKQAEDDAGRIETAAARFRRMLEHPEQTGPSQSSQDHYESSTRSSAGHILVVDDNSISRDLLCRLLEREGYSVASAVGGASALELAAEEKFDLVLLDVMMPDIDGIEVLQRWKAAGTLTELPVIVTSAMDEVSSAVRCIELGAEDYLTKPFDPVLFRARIGASIEKKRLRDRERAQGQRGPVNKLGEKGQAVGS